MTCEARISPRAQAVRHKPGHFNCVPPSRNPLPLRVIRNRQGPPRRPVRCESTEPLVDHDIDVTYM